MNHADIFTAIGALGSRQRRFLAELTRGAQGVLVFGKFEAHREEDGKVRPSGAALTRGEVDELAAAVPGLHFRAADAAARRPAYVCMPAELRARYADALTHTMPTSHLMWCDEDADKASAHEHATVRERVAA